MFLFKAILIMSVVYWVSALIADAIMTSHEERSLAPTIRLGFGFLIFLVYFSAAWLIMYISQAWVIGILLLACYTVGHAEFSFKENFLLKIKIFLTNYSKPFLFFILGAIIFFAPLIISNNYGPFTEGGGDISIYADTAKYLEGKHLTELGLKAESLSKNIILGAREALWPIPPEERWPHFDHSLIDPPATENSIYRVILWHGMNFFLYVPYAAYGFLSNETNYPVYFGIQAFLYVCMLGGIWYFFRPFGVKIAALATTLIVASHSIISVFYNMYAMQANSLAISALTLAILPSIKIFSRAGFRTYGSAVLIMWLSYIHYLSVILPIIIGATFFIQYHKKPVKFSNSKIFFLSLRRAATVVFLLLWFLVAWVGSTQSLEFAKSLFQRVLLPQIKNLHMYFGDSYPIFSLQWFSILFGFLSQQHFYPFVTEYPIISTIITTGVIFGLITLVVGGLIMMKIYISPLSFNGKKRFYLALYIISILTVITQFYLTRSSLYTQAKAAQYVLPYFYICLLLPIALGVFAAREGLKLRYTLSILIASLIFFTGTQLTVRMVYLTKLAFSYDRSTILEASYFSEAQKIKQADAQPFVLFEPRKSADLYMSMQPFFGARMVPTRHLVLQKETLHINKWLGQRILASDLIESNDLPHLWILNSVCKNKQWKWLNTYNCIWKADKLVDHTTPVLLLFGDNYEKNFGKRSLSEDARDFKESGMFSYVRNGVAMLFLPRGSTEIEVIMEPRNSEHYIEMKKEVNARIRKGEFGQSVKFSPEGRFIKLIYKLPAINASSLKLIAHYEGEFWLSIKVDHREIV